MNPGPRNFDIVQTPTLQAVAAGDEQQLLDDLQSRLDTAVQLAEARPEVVAAFAEQQLAQQHLQKLRTAERGLHQYAGKLTAKIGALRETALDGLIEGFGDDNVSDKSPLHAKPLTEWATYETRSRQISQAIARLVEQKLPLAQLAALREESHATMTKVKALEQIAQERAERLLEHLRSAVSEEVVLPIDMSKGVAGALIHQAAEYRNKALQLSEAADQLEKQYVTRTAGL